MTRSILVVEDDDRIRRLLVQYLEQRPGVVVDGARDGVDGLYKASQRAYAVVVLDLMMPKMSGVDFLDSLIAFSTDPSLKTIAPPPAVVVITSAPESEYPDEVLMRRCPSVRQVFRKPLDLPALTSCIERHLREDASA